MAEPSRQSTRIRDPLYRPRRSWDLPQIVSVTSYISFLLYDTNCRDVIDYFRVFLLQGMIVNIILHRRRRRQT